MKKCLRSCVLLATALCAAGCASDVPGLDPLKNQIRFPIGLAVHPSDKYLFVVNSNFDLQFNAATLTVVDTTTHAVLPEHTVRMASFGGEIVLRGDGTRAYVASRSDGQITAFDIDVNAPAMLRCTSAPAAPGSMPRCESPYTVSVDPNPFGLFLRPAATNVRVGCGSETEDVRETLVVTHLNTQPTTLNATGVVSLLMSPDDAVAISGKCQQEVSRKLCLAAAIDAPGGANGIGQNPATGTLYVTSRFDTRVSLLRAQGSDLTDLGGFIMDGVRLGLDHRGLAFKPDGTRAYIAYRSVQPSSGISDPMLAVIDTSCLAGGLEQSRVVGVVDLCLEPGKVEYLSQPGQPDRLYVPCGGNKEVYVIDPELLLLERIIDVADGAYSIVFTNGARTGAGLQRAYVSNFRDDSISVIELDPQSSNFHREVARIRENSRILP